MDAACWGLFSDVHGNLSALESALTLLQDRGATRLAFLGDCLGPGQPDACVQQIKAVADLAVVGNRDLDWQNRVTLESRRWARSLPRVASDGELLIAHGDDRLTPGLGTGEIRRGFKRAAGSLRAAGARVFAFGHSHHARLWRLGAIDEAPIPMDSTEVVIEEDSLYFLNVGTTGKPFPGKGGPSVALVDFAARRISTLALPLAVGCPTLAAGVGPTRGGALR